MLKERAKKSTWQSLKKWKTTAEILASVENLWNFCSVVIEEDCLFRQYARPVTALIFCCLCEWGPPGLLSKGWKMCTSLHFYWIAVFSLTMVSFTATNEKVWIHMRAGKGPVPFVLWILLIEVKKSRSHGLANLKFDHIKTNAILVFRVF